MEKTDIGDFLDIVYAYSINSPEMRRDFRSAMLGYLFDYTETKDEPEDTTFDGSTKTLAKQIQNKSLLDELDSFRDGLG